MRAFRLGAPFVALLAAAFTLAACDSGQEEVEQPTEAPTATEDAATPTISAVTAA